MDQMTKAFHEANLEIPEGLVHLVQTGETRRKIYRSLYAAAKFGSGLGPDMKTFVFPKVVREAIRERFPDDDTGVFDKQYEGRGDVYYISLDEMACMPYPKVKK